MTSFRVNGSVSIKDGSATVVLAPDGTSPAHVKSISNVDSVATSMEKSTLTCGEAADELMQKLQEGKLHIDESRKPFKRQHLSILVCHIQRELSLNPRGFQGPWSEYAQERLVTIISRPKRGTDNSQILAIADAPSKTSDAKPSHGYVKLQCENFDLYCL